MEYSRNFLRDWKPESDSLWSFSNSVIEMITEESEYLDSLLQRHNNSDLYSVWNKIREQKSRERLRAFTNRLNYGNEKIGGLDRAKCYPIENIIKFVNDFAKCPWHSDDNPSLHLIRKKNVAYCFSCQRSYDSIDAGKLMWGIPFKDVIKRLT